MNDQESVWDGRRGTAGGTAFAAALTTLANEREVTTEKLAESAGLSHDEMQAVLEARSRVTVTVLASFAVALRTRPIEFLQRTGILGLSAYAFGLDPLYFLPEGPIRYDARIYMREINPRHAVPEGDMTRRNATLHAVAQDEILDAVGKVELELAYLLRAAVQETGGRL